MKRKGIVYKFIMCMLAVLVLVSSMPMTSYAALDEEDAMWIAEADAALAEIVNERDVMALVYLEDEYPVRRDPSFESDAVLTVNSGQQVLIKSVMMDDDYEVWYGVTLEYNGEPYSGYVPRTNLAVSDSRFLEWESMYGLNFGGITLFAFGPIVPKSYPDVEQFPESYRDGLMALKEAHPNWTFVKMNTGLDWNTVIAKELGSKSLIYKTYPEWAKNGLYGQGTWYYASEAVLKKYMDPRNALTEDSIFQFEQLTYNAEYHTLEAMQRFLDNTFMNGSKPAPKMDTMTFAEMFWYIGKEAGREVSPFHLAARVLQEQGTGTSPLISGTYPGFEGYYNYFNIGASGTTNTEVIVSGLTYAKEHGWNSSYNSVLGGSDFISKDYIKKGQDTLYLEKFNVNRNGTYAVYTHQYMQNITAPTTEAKKIKQLYEGSGSLDNTFVFKIPVFDNMPATACLDPGMEPADSLNIKIQLPSGYSGKEFWLDGEEYQAVPANDTLVVVAPNKNAKVLTMYKYDASDVPVGMYVWTLKYENHAYVATPQPDLMDLLSYHGFSIRITGDTGIRFKTGMSATTKANLTGSGVNGFHLKESGTLIMRHTNREVLPMILDGEKVKKGVAYGYNANKSFVDIVFETVDNRHRYTGVLTKLPATEYKEQYAFRGYCILEKDGVSYTVYGPIRARSLYEMAKKLITNGTYSAGSPEYEYLSGLIQAADELGGANE